MKRTAGRLLIILCVLAAMVGFFVLLGMRPAESFYQKYAGYDLSVDAEGTTREGTYGKYLSLHEGAARPDADIRVELQNFISAEGVEFYPEFEGAKNVLVTEQDSLVSWEFDIEQEGFYNIYIEYLATKSRGTAIERAVYINGEIPFEDAANIAFTRIWKDGGEVRRDNQGNEIRPTQVEEFAWQKAYFRDDMGYNVEPYQFYFRKGKNSLTLEAVNEPIAIRELVIKAVKSIPDYEEYLAKSPGRAASQQGKNYIQLVQGEASTLRSDSSLYARYDRASASTKPYSVRNTILNYIGGDAWRSAGQWIEWEFSVPEAGYYCITIKGRQNYARGSVSSRTVYIDGEIPFDEMKEISFEYSNDWQCKTLSDEKGEPYLFYLTEGSHTIRLEATLGAMGDILGQLEDSTYRLNQIYRKILIYTGANPDKYRDYHIDKVYPEIIDAMDLESKRLYKIVDDMVALTGQKSDRIATAQTLAQQLERFVNRPDKISVEFTNFKDNITALASAVLNMSETKLDIDYLLISGEEARVPKDKAGFLDKLAHELRSIVASYVVDYDAVGDVYSEDDENLIKVWVLSGRDQGTILKTMVDDTFTPDTGIKVNVEIVAGDALLSAVVAGRGPDVVLSVGADQPVNYALRKSAEDLTQFPDYKKVFAEYTESSYEQYKYNGGIYGIPETQTFNVMFYRKDILEELGLEIPQTWQELIEMLPTIQGSNMSVGIPSAAGSSISAGASTAVLSNAPDLTLYISLLYQNGGDLYNEEGTKTIVNNEIGVKAFDEYTRYFTDYGIPVYFDFVSRFRSGEMPLGIMPYSTYNTLMVSAPEIRGLWDFTQIPGTPRVDENGNQYIDRANVIVGNASMMIKIEDEARRLRAWEFLKWWASAPTQVRFGREIEALLGSSARYNTANIEAFPQLAWSAKDVKTLINQWKQTQGIREVPGGYFTGRHITNAVRKVINKKLDPRETIIDYTVAINEELKKKRIEFGLETEQGGAQ